MLIKFFSFAGRLNRLSFLLRILLIQVIFIIIYLIIEIINNAPGLATVSYFTIVIHSVSNLSLITRRLHDLNVTGWVIIPLSLFKYTPPLKPLFYIAALLLVILKGTDGTNDYDIYSVNIPENNYPDIC
ncbi:DUF805 domain-containing protein [Vallitalea okinawensis]|uniref:DUF805 domain-containing protein n=1 Tax=Vallitalea okinawensis TaxID=2078660 RepID=UPI000CFAAF4D|nr:DUF805 domain-containing protein [Vallitalea okinawensis]